MIYKMKKVMFLLLLSFLFIPSVFAAGTGKITINNAVTNETYTLYKMFDLESYDKSVTPNVYAYKISDEWRPFFAAGAAGEGYIDIDADGYVTADELDTDNVEAFAKLALAYAKAHTSTITAVDSVTASSSSVVFDNLDLGYYLVDTTLGTLCNLDTTDDQITIQDKNIIPVLSATVKEGTGYAAVNDADIGDTIEFKLNINAYKGAEDYIVHATHSDGIAFDSATANIVVVEKGTVTDDTLVAGRDYNIVTSDIGSETFRIEFTDSYLDSITGTNELPTNIEITYQAKLDSDATIGGAGNISNYSLTYDEGSHQTATDSTKTYTWPSVYYKYYEDASHNKQPLANAKFSLSTTNSLDNKIELVNVSGTTYRVALASDSNKVTEITTTSTGTFTIQGLDSGDYYLIETAAPQGYNKLTAPVQLRIVSTAGTGETLTSSIQVLSGTNWNTVSQVEVLNKSGSRLPDTGGMGTKIFVTVGTVLFLSTAVVLVAKKRMYNEG